VIVVCSTSQVLCNIILRQAGVVVTEEYNRLSTTVNQQNCIIETGPGKLNCKAILFLSWIPPLNHDSTILQQSISEFVSKSLHHIFYHPKVYKTVAFPAVGCGLLGYPVDVIAKAMIDATVAKLTETMLYTTVSFVILPSEFNIHQRFADRMASLQKPSEPFGYIECSISSECM
jgi:O-acetyl-ADP-ribose deacetylase (regulator of RNase III)